MKRILLLLSFALLTTGLAFADEPSGLTKTSLQVAKSIEGGIAVNPVTHKAYLIAEEATEGSDDRKAVFVLDMATPTQPLKVVPIANENEYITIDSTRNLIYVATKFDTTEEETDASDGDVEPPGDSSAATAGTLTVIDGNTDTVIAIWNFDPGIEPEQVAVDTANSIVYVGAKAPEGESANNETCTSGTPIPDVGEPGDVECWTTGYIYVFFVDPAANPIITYLKTIPAGDDPESVVFADGMVYAANEDDGTVTIASAVTIEGGSAKTGYIVDGGELLTGAPVPPTLENLASSAFPYSLAVFYPYGPNPLGCPENQFEADKMTGGGGSVFITDDRSRVAKITGTAVAGMWDVPGATVCEQIPNSDGGGANTANNIAFMHRSADDREFLYVVSEQKTVAVFDPATMEQKATITIPEARHLDGIAVDGAANRVWLTDEDLQLIFILQGACADGTGECGSLSSQDSTTSTLSVAPNPAGEGAAVSFTATITTEGTHPPTGSVAFYDNGIPFDSGTLDASAVATLSNSTLFPGIHTITAVYGGDFYNAESTAAGVNLTINVLDNVTTSLNVTPTKAITGTEVIFSVTVMTTGTHTPTGTITFSDGGNAMGTVPLDASGKATFSTSSLTVGSHSIAAAYSGDSYNRGGTSNVVNLVVDNAAAPAITSANTTTFTGGSTRAFTVTVTGWPTPILSYAGTLPNGLTFADNGNGTATLAGTTAAAGTHSFTIKAENGVPPGTTQEFTLVVSASKAAMIDPIDGSALPGSTVTFTWGGGAGITNYYLWIGTTEGGRDLKNLTLGPGVTSYTATNLPTTGATLYVRLYSQIDGVNRYNGYTYTQANAAKAAMMTPVDGSTLPSSTVTFTWGGGSAVTNYYLWIGTTEGGRDLKNVTLGPSTISYTAKNLPANGETLYVRLSSLINGVYQYNSYSYIAATETKAAMISPTDGSTLPGSTVTFTWGGGAGVTNYYLWIGTTEGGRDLKNVTLGPSTTSYTAKNLPTEGGTLYVRLYTLINSVYQYNSYSYAQANLPKAAMISPAHGSNVSAASTTFTWSPGAEATTYYLWIGTTPGSKNVKNVTIPAETTTYTATALPVGTIYVRLYSLIDGAYRYNDYSYTAQ